MVALDFPPCQSAGVQRSLKFAEYLPRYGWEPVVLTANERIYEKLDQQVELSAELLPRTFRAFGLNTFKHFSIKGKYIQRMAQPDRYHSWYWHGAKLGKQLIKEYKPRLIWSTFPCSTAHKIAVKLKRHSGLPWVADFRDPFAGHHNPNKVINPSGAIIDAQVVKDADFLVFTTAHTAKLYLEAYPHIDRKKVKVIENGYNEDAFMGVLPSDTHESSSSDFTLLYSGTLYENGRDPVALFQALSMLKNSDILQGRNILLKFRGVDNTHVFMPMIQALGLDLQVEFLPSIAYQKSIEEMMQVDGLLLLQGTIFTNQIPGKVYEYLRACKPILALTNEGSATSELLKSVPHAVSVNMDSATEIASALEKIVDMVVSKDFSYQSYSRLNRTERLAALFSSIATPSLQ